MLRVLCLGCGNGLNTNLAESLKAIFRKKKHKFKLVVSNLKVGKNHTKKVTVEEQAKNGDFDIIVAMPGFGTFSRARHSGRPGPRPARSKYHPFGIPGRGFRATQATKAENMVILKLIGTIKEQAKQGKKWMCIYPEDLGSRNDLWPASFLHLDVTNTLTEGPDVKQYATRLAEWGAENNKPLRIVGNVTLIDKRVHEGAAVHDNQGFYKGPLPQRDREGHDPGAKVGRMFSTAGQAAWPEPWANFVACMLFDNRPTANTILASGMAVGQSSKASTKRKADASGVWIQPKRHKITEEVWTELIKGSQNHAFENNVYQDSQNKGKDKAIEGDPALDDCLPTRCPETVDKGQKVELLAASDVGWRGKGPPRITRSLGQERPFADGGGLCSPGRWAPSQRQLPKGNIEKILEVTRHAFDEAARRLAPGAVDPGINFVLQMAAKKFWSHPFEEKEVANLRGQVQMILHLNESQCQIAEGQATYLEMVAALLKDCGDPDWRYFIEIVHGVNLGVTEPMPRVKAVFEEKCKWRLGEDPGDGKVEVENYRSMVGYEKQVEALFKEEEAAGWMEEFPDAEAKEIWGQNLFVAALAVVVEKDKIRVVHDGSNGVHVNHRIRPLDQQRCPGAGELREILKERKEKGLKGIAVVGGRQQGAPQGKSQAC
jgi:hypothetical protein